MVSSRDVEDDAQLLSAWRAGDKRSGSILFDRHYPAMERFFRNKVGRASDDLIQETFAACVTAKDRFRAQSSFRTYLFGIAHNILRGHIRSRVREDQRVDWTEVTAAALDPSPSSMAARRQDQRAVLSALRSIPLAYQIVLELYYWEDISASEIGTSLDLPEGTIRSRIRKGKALLAERLSPGSAELSAEPAVTMELDEVLRSVASAS